MGHPFFVDRQRNNRCAELFHNRQNGANSRAVAFEIDRVDDANTG